MCTIKDVYNWNYGFEFMFFGTGLGLSFLRDGWVGKSVAYDHVYASREVGLK